MYLNKNQISIDILKPALIDTGWKNQTLELKGKNVEFFEKNNVSWKTNRAVVRYPFVSDSLVRLSINKTTSSEYVHTTGGNVPDSVELKQADSHKLALKIIRKYDVVVVKPSNSRASHGLSLNVTNPQELEVALDLAFTFSDTAIVQQMVKGDELRFTVLDGKVISVIHKQPAQLVGDGLKTHSVLLREENAFRNNIDWASINYPQLTLPSSQNSQYVPEHNEISMLGESSLMSKGASIFEVLEETHPSYIKFVQKLTMSLNAEFLVVDMLVFDWTKPATSTNWYFLEFNTSPSLQMYYSTRNNKPTKILEMIVEKLNLSNNEA